jgi:hypothetical protein
MLRGSELMSVDVSKNDVKAVTRERRRVLVPFAGCDRFGGLKRKSLIGLTQFIVPHTVDVKSEFHSSYRRSSKELIPEHFIHGCRLGNNESLHRLIVIVR